MEARQRPTSVTVVAVILIVMYGLSTLCALALPLIAKIPDVQRAFEAQHMNVLAAFLWPLAHGVIGLVAAIAILRGLNSGRFLYFALVPVIVILQWVFYRFSPMHVPSILLYIVFVVLLTRPKAAAYFGSGGPAEPASGN
jgi:hypothetical protein